MQKIITGLFLLIMTFSAYAGNDVPAGLNDYVTNLVNDASTTLNNSSLSQDAKIAKARELLHNNLDFDRMAKGALGRNIKALSISKEQIKEFTEVYSKYVTKAYTDLIKDYKGEQPQITGVRTINSNEFIVDMNIINKKGQDPIKVQYYVRKIGNSFKVFDVITSGISIVGAQREDFDSTLKNQGFDALIQNLKNRS